MGSVLDRLAVGRLRRSRRVQGAAVLLAIVGLALGWNARSPGEVAFPEGCDGLGLTERRCAAIVAAAASLLEIDPEDASSVVLALGPACPSGIDDECIHARAPFVTVRFERPGVAAAEQGVSCYGVLRELSLVCADPPAILEADGVDRDVRCEGEPPDGCATPVPTIDPAVQPEARPLEIAELAVPLDHVGRYEVPLGTARLPNGVLTEATFALLERHQKGFLLDDSVVRLVVRDRDGRVFGNVYDIGWSEGTVEVTASLVFDIVEFEPGTVLHVREIVVR